VCESCIYSPIKKINTESGINLAAAFKTFEFELFLTLISFSTYSFTRTSGSTLNWGPALGTDRKGRRSRGGGSAEFTGWRLGSFAGIDQELPQNMRRKSPPLKEYAWQLEQDSNQHQLNYTTPEQKFAKSIILGQWFSTFLLKGAKSWLMIKTGTTAQEKNKDTQASKH